ncbi:unnamed protein product [Paramecium sonneborni]|uniref:Rab-GAP TBC domain-containing protein n=1 Tax=Paramecium sonneborni TaxID=65129 RepID=A0A8S1PP34_9CILI|nr:unnamed protein product [Paramecium sonneborni]
MANYCKEFSNILHAFSNYRKYFRYKPDLVDIAVVLIKQIQEYDCFQALVNLLYLYHFLSVFQNDTVYSYRLNFLLDKLNREQRFLKRIYREFYLLYIIILKQLNQKLNYTSEMVLENIFSSIQIRNAFQNYEIISFCEGEIYLFKFAICYIKFFQIELKMRLYKNQRRKKTLFRILVLFQQEYIQEIMEMNQLRQFNKFIQINTYYREDSKEEQQIFKQNYIQVMQFHVLNSLQMMKVFRIYSQQIRCSVLQVRSEEFDHQRLSALFSEIDFNKLETVLGNEELVIQIKHVQNYTLRLLYLKIQTKKQQEREREDNYDYLEDFKIAAKQIKEEIEQIGNAIYKQGEIPLQTNEDLKLLMVQFILYEYQNNQKPVYVLSIDLKQRFRICSQKSCKRSVLKSVTGHTGRNGSSMSGRIERYGE